VSESSGRKAAIAPSVKMTAGFYPVTQLPGSPNMIKHAQDTSPGPVETIAAELSEAVGNLSFSTPSHVYNPLEYAWDGQQQYLRKFGNKPGRVLLMGMNPGPWGMAQTGVPFGEISLVRDWMGIEADLAMPLPEQHPKYPITGFECQRSEGSGKRLWGWARQRFGSAEAFFDRFFVWNYCPLLFLAQNRNLIPEKLTKKERHALFQKCDLAVAQVLDFLDPAVVIGVGRFAQKRAQGIVGDSVSVGYLHHPSPANPAANRNWTGMAEEQLGPWLPHG